MERAGNTSQQTLARNGDGSVAIAVRAQSEVVLPPETLLRAQQQTAQMKLLEKAKELQRYCVELVSCIELVLCNLRTINPV